MDAVADTQQPADHGAEGWDGWGWTGGPTIEVGDAHLDSWKIAEFHGETLDGAWHDQRLPR